MSTAQPQYVRGELNPQAKLTEGDVLECLALHERGHSYRQIATWRSVSISCVYAICRGKTWAWLTDIQFARRTRPARRRIASAPGQLSLFQANR
jgi:hypothetical protein